MDNNNEQEVADDDDNGNLFERIYLGQTLDYIHDVPFRLLVHLSVTEIDIDTFTLCGMLREVVFHNKVIHIGDGAFSFCLNLERVELPEGVLRLEDGAFRGCKSLREIVIPTSVQFIGSYAFRQCISLERVVFAPRTTSIELGLGMFLCSSNLRSVTFPQNLYSVPAFFFYGCTSLTHLLIPTTVEVIEESAFYGSDIQSVIFLEEDEFIPGTIMLPPNLHSISENCFRNCQSLTNIQIPPSVHQIGESALSGSGLRSINIPENVHQIDQEACSDCSSLKEVTIHASNNLTMAGNIFARCPLLSVIKMYPWLWPKLFASMNGHPDFILKFFRQYQTQIFDFETPTERSASSTITKRQTTMMDDDDAII